SDASPYRAFCEGRVRRDRHRIWPRRRRHIGCDHRRDSGPRQQPQNGVHQSFQHAQVKPGLYGPFAEGSGCAAEPFHFVAGDAAMLSETIGLTLFPATMAFAAASDLLTMTIANRLCLILVAGFAIVAVLGGLSATVLLLHLAAGVAVLAVAFFCFA